MAKVELDIEELIKSTFEEHFGVTIDRLRELAEADKDGRLVVLPCKAGDTLWNIKLVFSFYKDPKEETVDRFAVSDDGVSAICRSGYKFRIERIGKTVFLTREAAEAELEAQK